MVLILSYKKKPIISLCAIHITPSIYFTFRSKLTEEGSFLEAKKILGIEHNQATRTYFMYICRTGVWEVKVNAFKCVNF